MTDEGHSPMLSKSPPGCLVCRSRKVKCDRTVGECRNCLRLGVECPGYDDSSSGLSRDDIRSCVEDIYQNSGIEKRRVGSCKECRTSKSKCSRSRPKCRRCAQRSLKCTYPSSRLHQFATSDSEDAVLREADSEDLPEMVAANGLEWLYAPRLPDDKDKLRLVFHLFFDRIASLRCLGFIHKPSFLQSLDSESLIEDYGEALVLVVSALGARVYLHDNIAVLNFNHAKGPGHAWAVRAQELAMRDISCPSVITLMTMILVSEYAARCDEHALAFITWGCAYQIMRLLGLDSSERIPKSGSPSDFTRKETERRLLWSCFIMDSFIGSGIDANLRWKEDVPNVLLPASDACFLEQIRFHLSDLATVEFFNSPTSFKKMNIHSQVIHLAYLRTQFLRLIRKSNPLVAIWHPQSSFLKLIQHLDQLHSNIQEEFNLNSLSMYIRRELNTLGSVFMLHFFYHSIVCDLTRISLPGYEFPLAAAFRNAPISFRQQCQDRCRFHADQISNLVQTGLAAGKGAFDDLQCALAVFESTKIQIVHTCTTTSNGRDERLKASSNIRYNMRLLGEVHLQRDKPNPYHRRLLPLLTRFGFHDIVCEWSDARTSTKEKDELVGPPEISYLSSAASFRLATLDVQNRQRLLQQKSQSVINTGDINTKSGPENDPPIVTGIYVPEEEPSTIYEPHIPSDEPESLMMGSNDDQDFYTDAMDGNLNVPDLLDISAFSSQDFIRLAEEMSENITWDVLKTPY